MTGIAQCWKHYARRTELRSRVEPMQKDWLGACECGEFSRLRDSERREGWFWGRILSKELIINQFPAIVAATVATNGTVPFLLTRKLEQFPDPRSIEITSRGADGRGVRPCISINGREQPWSISISHSQQAILVALCTDWGVSLGVDLVDVAEYSGGFLETSFSSDERDWLRQDRPEQIATAWAVKEAVYKAYNAGEGFTPRRICVRPLPSGRYTCAYYDIDLTGICDIQTWQTADQAAAMATVATEHSGDRSGAYESGLNASV
jgi:phosphopantetheinyl transferase